MGVIGPHKDDTMSLGRGLQSNQFAGVKLMGLMGLTALMQKHTGKDWPARRMAVQSRGFGPHMGDKKGVKSEINKWRNFFRG